MKVAIIGASPSRRFAPWADQTWQMWALNEIPQPRAELHWEMHPRSVQSEQDFAWLRESVIPCMVLDPDEWKPEEIPAARRYPIEAVLTMPGVRDWFSATFAYQVAYAVLTEAEEIGLWGVDLALGTPRESTVEWACLAWWLGYAAGRGVTVTIPRSATWSHPARYGYDYWAEVHAVKDYIAQRRADWQGWEATA